MNELDHSTLVMRYKEGKLAFGMEPAHARRLFTDVNGEALIAKIGEDLRLERFLVVACIAISWWGYLISLPVAVWALGWWAVVAIPVATIIRFHHLASAGKGKQSLFFEVIVLATAILVPPIAGWDTRIHLWLTALTASMLAARLIYFLSGRMVGTLVLRNPKAYDWLSKDIRVQEVEQAV